MFSRTLIPAIFSVLAACSLEPRNGANQLLVPDYMLPGTSQNAEHMRKRGAVEFFVKDNHARLMSEINRGDGPYLDEAIALAGVPQATRAALKLDLRGDRALYNTSADALVTTLMSYGT